MLFKNKNERFLAQDKYIQLLKLKARNRLITQRGDFISTRGELLNAHSKKDEDEFKDLSLDEIKNDIHRLRLSVSEKVKDLLNSREGNEFVAMLTADELYFFVSSWNKIQTEFKESYNKQLASSNDLYQYLTKLQRNINLNKGVQNNIVTIDRRFKQDIGDILNRLEQKSVLSQQMMQQLEANLNNITNMSAIEFQNIQQTVDDLRMATTRIDAELQAQKLIQQLPQGTPVAQPIPPAQPQFQKGGANMEAFIDNLLTFAGDKAFYANAVTELKLNPDKILQYQQFTRGKKRPTVLTKKELEFVVKTISSILKEIHENSGIVKTDERNKKTFISQRIDQNFMQHKDLQKYYMLILQDHLG